MAYDPQRTEAQAKVLSTVAPPSQYPTPDAPNRDFFQYRLDGTDIVEEIEHNLRGEMLVIDEFGNAAYKQKFTKEMNDEGVKDVISLVYTCGINRNVLLGCLSHDEIYQRCASLWVELAKYIFLNGERVGINITKRDILIKKIVYMVHSGLSRSEGGREADQLSTQHSRIEHFMQEDRPKDGLNANPFKLFGLVGGRR